MNPFDRARRQAFETREALVGLAASLGGVSSSGLLAHVEDTLEIAIERLPFGHPELGGGSGVLKREIQTIYIRNDVSQEKRPISSPMSWVTGTSTAIALHRRSLI